MEPVPGPSSPQKQEASAAVPFKWPCLECGKLTRQRCRCAVSLCKSCKTRVHMPPCNPPPDEDAWNLRLFDKYGFRFDGNNMAKMTLPTFGGPGELEDILFPMPRVIGNDVKLPGIFYQQSILRAKNSTWAAFWDKELKPHWYYLVPRLMLPAADAMLGMEVRKAMANTVQKKHAEVYSFYETSMTKLSKLLDKRVVKLEKLVHDRYPKLNTSPSGLLVFSKLALLLQDTPSKVFPGRNAYGARYPEELGDLLEEAGAPELVSILYEIRDHYASSP